MNSLRARLTLRLLLGGMLLLGAAGALVHWQVRRSLTAQFDAALRATAQSLTSLTEQKRGEARIERVEEHMPQFERANGPEVFLLRTAEGREIERSRSLGTASLSPRAGTLEAPAFFDASLPDGRFLRCAGVTFTPHLEDDDDDKKKKQRPPISDVQLVVGHDRAPIDSALAALRNSLLLVGAGALAILAALLRWEVRKGLAPLDRLGESVAAVSAGSLATRFPVESLPAELRPITARLNELLARLESAFARERRFTATAAHELRTPLAELRALAEVNLTTPATDAERADSWQDSLSTTLRMEGLALRLLELSRVEHQAGVLHRESVVLATAFAAAWKPWDTKAKGRGLSLDSTLSPNLTAETDPVLLGIVLGNLCSNAVEHADANSPIRVSATESATHVILHVQNRAKNLTAADIPRLFERFWRKEEARSEFRHHGLGLALAAEYSAVLGGSLTADLSSSGDLKFSLQLPRQS